MQADFGQDQQRRRRSVHFGLLLLLAVVFCAHPLRAQDSPLPTPALRPDAIALTLDEYRALLEDARTQLGSPAPNEPAPPAVLEEFAAVGSVVLASGETVLLSNLLHDATTARTALARIDLVLEQLELSARDNLAEREAALNRVLARPEFSENVPLMDRISGWIDNFLEWLFPDQDQNAANQAIDDATNKAFGALEWTLTSAGGVLIAILLGYWMQRLVRNFVGDAELRRRRATGEEMPLSAGEARAQAVEQAQAGSFRAAVRSLYLSALLALEENEVISSDRTLTNRELLARTRVTQAGEQITPAMQPVVQRFDDVWYGMTEPDATTYATYEQDIERLNQTISNVKMHDAASVSASAKKDGSTPPNPPAGGTP